MLAWHRNNPSARRRRIGAARPSRGDGVGAPPEEPRRVVVEPRVGPERGLDAQDRAQRYLFLVLARVLRTPGETHGSRSPSRGAAAVAAPGVVRRVGAVVAELVLPEAQRRVQVLDEADDRSIEAPPRQRRLSRRVAFWSQRRAQVFERESSKIDLCAFRDGDGASMQPAATVDWTRRFFLCVIFENAHAMGSRIIVTTSGGGLLA